MPPYQLELPPMYRVRQSFDRARLEDVNAAVDATMEASGVSLPVGGEVAITAGSRGIANIQSILARVVHNVKAAGAVPFIIPAMGSHGGAHSEGQKEMLANLGITEETMGCEIRSEIEPVTLPQEDCPLPVFMDQHAHRAAATIVINRIKIHTAFRGTYESGLVKMMAVGMGKHKQALAIHGRGTRGLAEEMPKVAKQILKHGNVVMGIGIVENAYDETMHIEAMPADQILEREPVLLDLARKHIPRLPLDEIDILIVDRMGKNLSGTGMDGNMIGRLGVADVPDPETPKIRTIVVRDLTPESKGNALGIGLADITTRKLYDKIDMQPLLENLYTSTYLPRGKIPVVVENDWEAVAFAARSVTGVKQADLKIVRIDSTLHVDELQVSKVALPLLQGKYEVHGEVEGPYFDEHRAMVVL